MNTTKIITRASVFNFWNRDIQKYPAQYIDCGEFITTTMGEEAAEHFGCMTDDGQSEIEREIFDWAVEYTKYHTVGEFE